MVEFAINSSINATTGYAPFELNHGYMPQLGQHISTDTTFKGVKPADPAFMAFALLSGMLFSSRRIRG